MSNVAVIEFIGPPGCGKTTLAGLAQDSLNSSGYQCLDLQSGSLPRMGGMGGLHRLRTMLHASFFYIRQPLLLIEMARFVASLQSSDPWVRKIALIMLKQAYMVDCAVRAAEAKGCDYVIFDQAILQSIWSILLHSDNMPRMRLRCLLSAMRRYIAPTIIQCQLDNRTAYKRMTNRECGWSRLADMDEETAISLLEKRLPYFSAIAWLAQKAAQCDVLPVDTRQDRFDVRDQILRFLVDINHDKTLEEPQHV